MERQPYNSLCLCVFVVISKKTSIFVFILE
jgi:hypothetical protein